jgi:hypothetical protein
MLWSNKCDKNNELIMDGMHNVSHAVGRMSTKLEELVLVLKSNDD